MRKPKAIDIFCGAGGLSTGLEDAGFEIVAGNDFNETAALTFKASHPRAHFVDGPIQNLDTAELMARLGLVKGELDVLCGGPPCQGYSINNPKRSLEDERAKLYHEYLRIVREIQPKFIVMENVMGMLMNGGEAAKAVVAGLQALGYRVEYRVHEIERFGVPQERRRVLFFGNRVGAPIVWPQETHGPGLRAFVTVGQALGDLPEIPNGGGEDVMQYLGKAQNDFQRYVRRGSRQVVNHINSRLGELNMNRMKHVPPGGSWRDIPVDLLPPRMQTAKRSDHTKRYGRLKVDGLSSTILTKVDVHWGTFYHPTQERVISVREAARLQSFPDRVAFQGSLTDQYIQIGNAVPPLLGVAIGKALLSVIEGDVRIAA